MCAMYRPLSFHWKSFKGRGRFPFEPLTKLVLLIFSAFIYMTASDIYHKLRHSSLKNGETQMSTFAYFRSPTAARLQLLQLDMIPMMHSELFSAAWQTRCQNNGTCCWYQIASLEFKHCNPVRNYSTALCSSVVLHEVIINRNQQPTTRVFRPNTQRVVTRW